MFDFGDELIYGNQRIPWLLWIQILVLLLLIILLYYFIIFAFGLDLSANAAAASPSAAAAAAAAASTSQLHDIKVDENHCIEDGEGTITQIRKVRREDFQERLRHSYHPCHYFGLAKQAFLKCLGLDPSSKDSPKEE